MEVKCNKCGRVIKEHEFSHMEPIMDGVEIRCPWCYTYIAVPGYKYTSMFDDEKERDEESSLTQEDFYNLKEFLNW